MKASVTKIVRFEMAHMLDECYSQECKRIHGHSYKLEVTFEGEVNPATGMIIDFKAVKEMLQPVVDRYDHQFLTSETYGKNPTAENMAIDIFAQISKQSALIKRVRLWETHSAFAEVSF